MWLKVLVKVEALYSFVLAFKIISVAETIVVWTIMGVHPLANLVLTNVASLHCYA